LLLILHPSSFILPFIVHRSSFIISPMPQPPDQGGWGSASAPRPVEQILGPGALWAGPYSLLGLRPGAVTDVTILAALDRRLEQIAAHALRDSPEADETRLALHAAAAQLLDPSVRRHLEAR